MASSAVCYFVELGTEAEGFVFSRGFRTLVAARRWARRFGPARVVRRSMDCGQ